MRMLRRKRILIVLLAVILLGIVVGITVGVRNTENTKGEIPEITIYLDHENQIYVRAMVAMYKNLSDVAQYSGESDQYPLINWNLVDKSTLSAEEYRSCLLRELESGKGPDLIFLDSYSCENPADFMAAGYLSGLNSWLEGGRSVFEVSDFLPGMLDAGALEGEQYFIPVSVDVPVLLTTRERLERTGFSEEEIKDAEAVFAAAAAYQRQSGNAAFDSGDFLDELSRYIGDQEGWSEQLRSDVRELGTGQSGEKDKVTAAKAFADGKYLFLTAGIDDYRCMAAQASMLPEDEEIMFIPLYRTGGGLQAVIRQAVAVNHNSPNQAAAQAALNAFCQEYVNNCTANLPVAGFFAWNDLLSDVVSTVNIPGQRKDAFNGNVGWKYAKIIKKLVDSVSCQPYPMPEKDRGEGCDGKKLLTVMLPEDGWNEAGVLYQWIAAAAEAYETETGIHVEICEGSTSWWYEKLLLKDTAADITVLHKALIWLTYEDTVGHVLDYHNLTDDGGISQLPWKAGVIKTGKQSALPGIPYMEEKGLVSSFVVSAWTELPQEAMEFITFCLGSEAYDGMLERIGGKSVLQN